MTKSHKKIFFKTLWITLGKEFASKDNLHKLNYQPDNQYTKEHVPGRAVFYSKSTFKVTD